MCLSDFEFHRGYLFFFFDSFLYNLILGFLCALGVLRVVFFSFFPPFFSLLVGLFWVSMHLSYFFRYCVPFIWVFTWVCFGCFLLHVFSSLLRLEVVVHVFCLYLVIGDLLHCWVVAGMILFPRFFSFQ